MCAKSKALWFVSLPMLLLAVLTLTTGRGEAVPKTVDQCQTDHVYCSSECGIKEAKCNKEVGVGCEAGRILCRDNCDTAEKDCIKDAGKGRPRFRSNQRCNPRCGPVEQRRRGPKVRMSCQRAASRENSPCRQRFRLQLTSPQQLVAP
jgi:hypothetical protein